MNEYSQKAAIAELVLLAMEPTKDAPLPATLAFVLTIGGLIVVGWVAMFLLLRARW